MWRVLVAVVYAAVNAAVVYAQRALRERKGELTGASAEHAGQVRALVERPTGLTLADVGGLADAKAALRRAVLLPLQRPDIFYGPTAPRALRPPPGVLLHGPPGTGKTMLARSLASEAGVPMLVLHAAALESKWWGEAPKLLAAAFAVARRELAPCVVFFDEVDGFGRARRDDDAACVYGFKCELLRHLDEAARDDATRGVVVLACTNCPGALDAALRRRFPREVHVAAPDDAGRRAVLRALARKHGDRTGALRARVARETRGFTGADLAALYADASAARLDGAAEVAHEVQDGAELLARLGPLAWKHWEAALAQRRPVETP